MSLHLAGGKVVKVAPTTPRDLSAEFICAGQKVEKIDASKYFVCPGLIDCEYSHGSCAKGKKKIDKLTYHTGHVHLMAVHGSAVRFAHLFR
jgi:imidazolonepropionase-like amidohydrolase